MAAALPEAPPASAVPARVDRDDPVESARAARLHYVSDAQPGIRRRREGDAVTYVMPDGREVDDDDLLRRIRSLVIPPAWTDVWICRDPQGHVQATGRDARGRKQYRYHPRWREVRDAVKYDRMLTFGASLPRIRERTEHDLGLPGMPREKVLATVVRLLEETRIRIGNEEYRKENGSFGLTTLRHRHADVEGSAIRFQFRGKSGKQHTVRLSDRRLARIIKRCQELPGQELFQYVDEQGDPHPVESEDVNEYLREIAGDDFTAKDFRTWAGTILAARYFRECEPCGDTQPGTKEIVRTIARVAEQLGNTPAVCKKCYVHPAVIAAYLAGTLQPRLNGSGNGHAPSEAVKAGPDLSAEERELLALLSNAPGVRLAERKRRRRAAA
ncbi:MAG TPA: DNA topoisomerase IB [Candidatus Limnocylindrales bacterium]|nr:DNA topoisomerase IB [Candidatus Limnocylindrales bacterium]